MDDGRSACRTERRSRLCRIMCRRKRGTVNGSRHSPTPGIEPLNSERYRGGRPAQTSQRSSRSHKPALREHHPGLRPLCANRGSHPAVGRVLTAPGCSWFESDSSSVSQIILQGPSTAKGAHTHSPRPNSFSWAASFNSEAPVS
jgi:hypothetical protein